MKDSRLVDQPTGMASIDMYPSITTDLASVSGEPASRGKTPIRQAKGWGWRELEARIRRIKYVLFSANKDHWVWYTCCPCFVLTDYRFARCS